MCSKYGFQALSRIVKKHTRSCKYVSKRYNHTFVCIIFIHQEAQNVTRPRCFDLLKQIFFIHRRASKIRLREIELKKIISRGC